MKKIILLIFILSLFGYYCKQPHLNIENGYVKTQDGVNLYYNKVGMGSEVVIIPAGMYLADEFKQLANNERTVIFYDQRGRGNSDEITDQEKIGIEHEISDLESIRNHFKEERISLIGWSYSGAVIALYTIRYPQHVNKVIQIGPIVPRKDPYWEQYLKTSNSRLDDDERRMLEDIHEKYQNSDKTVEYIKEYYRIAHKAVFYGEVVEDKFRQDFYTCENERPGNVWNFVLPNIIESLGDWDFRADLSNINIPFLTIHGTYDAIPIESAKEWVE